MQINGDMLKKIGVGIAVFGAVMMMANGIFGGSGIIPMLLGGAAAWFLGPKIKDWLFGGDQDSPSPGNSPYQQGPQPRSPYQQIGMGGPEGPMPTPPFGQQGPGHGWHHGRH